MRSEKWQFVLIVILVVIGGSLQHAAAIGGRPLVSFDPGAQGFVLAHNGRSVPLYASREDFPGVLRVLSMFRRDLEQVTGSTPALALDTIPSGEPIIIIVGTIGKSPAIDGLVRDGKLNVRGVAGEWESSVIQVVAHPVQGVDRALVIAGSDKRGTIYGMFWLSEQMGVSPWYWWADVPVKPHPDVIVMEVRHVISSPSVKYRGIFLNDEYPALTRWVQAKFGSAVRNGGPPIPADVANYGHEFYSRVFELLLRLKANYLWPAMWNNAFNEDDPENPRLADELGIVMGTSHQEPMLRAQKEWDRRFKSTLGSWNYAKHPDTLSRFWRDGIRRNKDYESIITIGLRGADDTPMAPGGVEANRKLLEQIIAGQRNIITEETGRDVTAVPQLWCLYKEVLEFYNAGMRAPDDVTLLWPDDNWGNIRRLPTAEERKRKGGAGIYYHFDYHGSPRSYQWVNTNQLAKIWDQMSLAKQYGADRIWIVNVGHLKGYELPIEYFMDLAWDTSRWTNSNIREYTRLWAAREFSPVHAIEIADILNGYTRFNGRRKPELLTPSTYSLVNYNEAESVVGDYRKLAQDAERISQELPAVSRDAFYELVLFPTKASALVNELYVTAGKNALYARQGRAGARALAEQTRRLFDADTALMGHFNRTLAGGKWDHFMDQSHLGYMDWADPPTNSLRAITLVEPVPPSEASLGVAVEGSEASWPSTGPGPALPVFDPLNDQKRTIEIFNRGTRPFPFVVRSDRKWVKLSSKSGEVSDQTGLQVSIDWRSVVPNDSIAVVRIDGAGSCVMVIVRIAMPRGETIASLSGFFESNGYVSIEAEHYTRATVSGRAKWVTIEEYGHTLSGMRAESAVEQQPAVPGNDSPCLQYGVHLLRPSAVDVTGIFGPTLNFIPGRDLRYAVSFDDAPPQTVTLVPKEFNARHGDMVWEKLVADNAHHSTSRHIVASPGYHTLKIWMIDPAVVLEKLVIDLGGLRPSYLGPPESYKRITR